MGIYHRDLKPQNVLRYADDETHMFYAVSDFGLIAMNESRVSVLTVTAMAKGTDYYTAPEITTDLRRASPQSDIYSLGCIIHEIVCLEARIPCHEIKESGDYGAILRTCTRADPRRRFRSVRSVLDALITISNDLPPLLTEEGAAFGDRLASGQPLDKASWRSLIDFVEDHEGQDDAKAVLGRLALDQVTDLCAQFADLGDRLGQAYSRWVNDTSFAFERCDSVANVIEVFISSCSFETKADAIMGLLKLGTSHNRWYVERKFCNLCSSNMDEALACRLSVEFRAFGKDICALFSHLERSIGVNRTILHPALQQTLHEICR